MTRHSLSVTVPWSLSHYIPLNGFHPLYRALFDHVPEHVVLSAWDNVKLYHRIRGERSIRSMLLTKIKTEQDRLGRSRGSVEKRYLEHFWPPNQVLTAELTGDIEFHHTAPFASLKRPFVFHCESFAPMLFPFAQQGSGSLKSPTRIREYYRKIFANPLCLGIFSHIPETLQTFKQFFSDPTIDQKLFASKIGLSQKAFEGIEGLEKPTFSRPRFLFVNSAHQNPANFFLRGGHLVLRFWKEFVTSGRDGLLMLRCAKPSDKELLELGVDVSLVNAEMGRSIIWAQDYLTGLEMNALMANAHFFLLPSASLHSVSIMQAMTLGTIPVVSDTVGTSAYIADDKDGIVLKGMRKALWSTDEATGILVDCYRRIPDLDDSLVAQMTSRVCALVEDPSAYWNMRTRTLTRAREQFSGQDFSKEFWNMVYDLNARFRSNVPSSESDAEGENWHKCHLEGDGWARVFESPPRPMLRMNTGCGLIWEMGGAFIHRYGNTGMRPNDWSVAAQLFSTGALEATFSNTIEELGGKYLRPIDGSFLKARLAFIGWISRILRPWPWLYRSASYVYFKLRRFGMFTFDKARAKAYPEMELIRHGVSGYNIIRHVDRYYAILQSEGAFLPEKAKAGGYSSCFSADSLDEVLRSVYDEALRKYR